MRLTVKDDDLQVMLTSKDFPQIYQKYTDEELKVLEEAVAQNTNLEELEGSYESMREIRDQFIEAYKELIGTSRSKEEY